MRSHTLLPLTLALLAAPAALAGGGGAPVAGGAACKNIGDLVATTPQFSTLLTAVQAAGLVETLNSKGPFTVFAPTNDAFNAVPSDTLSGLLNDPAALKKVLLYHVVPGRVTAAQVVKLKQAKTAEGSTAPITVSGGKVKVGSANVIRTDIKACNGVVHVIDAVLIPASVSAAAPAATPAAPAAAAPAAPATAATPAAPATAFDVKNIPALPLGVTAAPAATDTSTTTDASAAPATTDATATTDSSATTTTDATATTTTDSSTTTTDSSATTTTDAAAPAATDTTAQAAPAGNTIYDIVAADDNFSTLRDLLSDADLTTTLMEGEYTVFAPTNDAFAKVDEATLALIASNPEALKKVLLYHVVPGKVDAAAVSKLTEATSAEGSKLAVKVDGSSVKINDASVSKADQTASNGIIHVIDSVLLPPDVDLTALKAAADAAAPVAATTDTTATASTSTATTATTTTPAATATTNTTAAASTTNSTTPSGTIADLVATDPRFTTLKAAVAAAGLTETLRGGEFTVFAPTNAAFSKIPKADLDKLLADPAALKNVLLYHVVAGKLSANAIKGSNSLQSAQGQPLTVKADGSTVMINDATVIAADVSASNGIVHAIDTVLLPK